MTLRTTITCLYCLLLATVLGCGDEERPATCEDDHCEPTTDAPTRPDAGNDDIPRPDEPGPITPMPEPDPGEDDRAMEPDAGMALGSDAGAIEDAGRMQAPIPQDGSQLTPCATNLDCADKLMCYTGTLDRLGYCSAPCTNPPFGTGAECDAADGADYVCSLSRSLCEIECSENDDSNCPSGMECINVGFGLPAFRCMYTPDVQVPDREGAAFEPCKQDRDCADDLLCPPQLGYCTEQCAIDSHCGAEPEVGQAVCDTINNLCLVGCESDADCADGFTCGFVPQGLAQVLACRILPTL